MCAVPVWKEYEFRFEHAKCFLTEVYSELHEHAALVLLQYAIWAKAGPSGIQLLHMLFFLVWNSASHLVLMLFFLGRRFHDPAVLALSSGAPVGDEAATYLGSRRQLRFATGPWHWGRALAWPPPRENLKGVTRSLGEPFAAESSFCRCDPL